MNRTLSLFLFPLLLVILQLSAYCPINGFWVPSAEVDGKIGSFRKGAGITLFAPICENDSDVVFWQTNFGNYRKVWTGSLGLGYRRLITPYAALGVNGFTDVSYSEASRTYAQFGFGGELLGRCWEARFNGYIPTTKRTLVHEEIMGASPFVDEQTRLLFSTLGNYRLAERSYKGFDAEAGYSLKLGRGQLWGYGGYYWFRDRGTRTIEGPRVRVEYHLFNLFRTCGTRVVLGGEWAYDYLHRNQGLFYASLRIPLCGFKPGCGLDVQACQVPTLCQRMNNRVIREPGIWIDRTREDEHYDAPILGTLTKAPRHLFFLSEGGEGDGSLASPLSLKEGVFRAGVEDFLFVVGKVDVEGPLCLKYGQTIMSSHGASEIPLDFIEYGIYNVALDGEKIPRGVLNGDGVNEVVCLAHHSVIRDIDIDARNGPHAIVGDKVQNIRVSRASIGNTSSHGMLIADAINSTIYDTDFNDIKGSAIKASGTNSVFRNIVALNNVTKHGIDISASDGVLVERLQSNLKNGYAITASNSHLIILREINGNQSIALNNIRDFALHDSELNSTKETVLAITNCSGQGLIKKSTLKGKNNTILDITGGKSDLHIDFAGENTITSEGGSAVVIQNFKGAFEGKNLDIVFTGTPRSIPFIIEDVSKASFGVVSLKPSEACLAAASLINSNVAFDELVIDNPKGYGLLAQSGRLDIGKGVILTKEAPALELSHIKGEIKLDSIGSTKSSTHGMTLYDFNGSLTVEIAKVIEAQNGAIDWNKGAGSLQVLCGVIKNNSGHIISLSNLSSESSALINSPLVDPRAFKDEPIQRDENATEIKDWVPGIQSEGGKGVAIFKCEGPILITGVDLECVDSAAYSAITSTGSLALTNAKLSAANAKEIIEISDCAYFLLEHCELKVGKDLERGVRVTVTEKMPTIRITQDGKEDCLEASSQNLIFQNNRFLGGEGLTGDLFDVKVTDCPAITQIGIYNNNFNQTPHPFSGVASGSEGSLHLMFKGNKGSCTSGPVPIKLEQKDQAKVYLSHREDDLMVHNPELSFGKFEPIGTIFIKEEPQAPKKEEFAMGRALGLLPKK